jgi:hypothetical protein
LSNEFRFWHDVAPLLCALLNLQLWRRQLSNFWQNSVYKLKPEGSVPGSRKQHNADYVASYRDAEKRAGGGAAVGQDPGTLAMTLHSVYFPEDLYSKQKRCASGLGVGFSCSPNAAHTVDRGRDADSLLLGCLWACRSEFVFCPQCCLLQVERNGDGILGGTGRAASPGQ